MNTRRPSRTWTRSAVGAMLMLITAIASGGCASGPAVRSATGAPFDLVIVNAVLPAPGGKTMHEDAIAIRGNEIVELGRSTSLASACMETCEKWDARGGFVTAGFHDAHSHPYKGGALFHQLRLKGAKLASLLEQIETYARANPSAPWIIGRGWDAAGFGEHLPDRHALDRVVKDRPIALTDSDGHAVWTNTAALNALNVTRKTPDPSGGTILRDTKGEPTGIFLESAREIVYSGIPIRDDELESHLLKGQEILIQAGFTSWAGGPVTLRQARRYAALDHEKKILQRTFLWAEIDTDEETFLEWLEFARELPSDGKIRLNGFKGFVDGVVSSHSAALIEPYSDRANEKGELRIRQDRLERLVLRANRAGFRVALHAIGDRAVRAALDAFELSKNELAHSLVNSIEHIELLHPDDTPRFAALGVAAGFQPSHMYFDSKTDFYYFPRLGRERVRHTFAWESIRSTGGTLVFGTDFPVVEADPVEGMYCAVKRRFVNGRPFHLEQAISGDEALKAFTSTPAWAVGLENRLGRLEPGFLADLTVFQKDIRKGDARALRANPVKMVLIDGQKAYER